MEEGDNVLKTVWDLFKVDWDTFWHVVSTSPWIIARWW